MITKTYNDNTGRGHDGKEVYVLAGDGEGRAARGSGSDAPVDGARTISGRARGQEEVSVFLGVAYEKKSKKKSPIKKTNIAAYIY